MESKVLKYLPWAILVIICLLFLNYCSDSHKERAAHDKNMAFANKMLYNNEATLMRTKNELGQEIVTQKTLYLSEKEAKEMALIENTRLKKINSEIKVKTTTKIKEIFVETTIVDTFIVVNGDTVRDVRIFRVQDEWYGVSGTVIPSGVLFDSIYFKNEIVATLGYEKQKGFLKKAIPVLDIINKNPYSRVDEVYNVTVAPRKKMFFEKTWFKVAIGAGGGFWLRSKFP